ncbi:hypothetical protein J2W32_000340 [Variovorax boronicumulans]|uniref:Uncharacterized protein n=1 Tax=Variovorax boronicumulans TaxID=436515 RepID=A0AAW8CU26_9BURK|nr:hypothetical protein [Variovorax boronicumulans]MDP9891243.1 hypothetical protein [Variovorax boronicumulans]MDQ0051311.1 hypothetical protein [Variovorax boronicumulans]
MDERGKDEGAVAPQKESGKTLLNWRNIRDFAIVLGLLVCAWKVARADFNINFSEFSFTDLLAMILALFSVWLSVMFYFKADEASSKFYDNSYRFTRDMSVVLGRIEAGFGERLRHLDEGYSHFRNEIGRLTGAGALVKQEELVVEEKRAELREIVESLAAEPTPNAPDKDELLAKLRRTNGELAAAQEELGRLRAAAAAEGKEQTMRVPDRARSLLKSFAQKIRNMDSEVNKGTFTSTDLQGFFRVHGLRMLSPRTRDYLVEVGLIETPQGPLTELGMAALANAIFSADPSY